MTALVLEPHHDDAVLFSSWNAIRHRAHIVTVLRSVNQEGMGITHGEREAESSLAAQILGCRHSQWQEPDSAPDWERIEVELRAYEAALAPEHVFAPWPEARGGNQQHDAIGALAASVFPGRVTHYTTYRTGGPRTTGTPVPYEREWVLLKLRALACFRSQIRLGPVRFFAHALDEWTRP